MEQWEKNYYITALAGANSGSSLVVMSKGNLLSVMDIVEIKSVCISCSF